MGKPIRLKTDTPTNVRKSLAKIINMVANGEMPVAQANSIVLACNSILGCIKADEQEKRIKELEELLSQSE